MPQLETGYEELKAAVEKPWQEAPPSLAANQDLPT
jgi:hypothetical protein